MVSIIGVDLGVDLPTISTQGVGYYITIIAIFVLFVLIFGVLIYVFYMNRLFNKKIILFENISGTGWQNTGKDRARIIKVGDGGEELMYLRKKKVYRTAYGKKMGPNTYWFAIGQDGYWYNVVLGDLDAKMGMLDIEPIDRDMRYMHVAIRKNIQERYRKIGFMEKYGQTLMSGIFLLIMIIAIWLLISKVGDLITQAQSVLKASQPIAESMQNIVGNLDKICGGSGIYPA